MDYAWHTIHIENDVAAEFSDYVIARLREYEDEQHYKFVGGGITVETFKICPYLTTRLWAELDIVAVIFRPELEAHSIMAKYTVGVDEEADSMARKAIRHVHRERALWGESADQISESSTSDISLSSALAI